MADNPPQQPLRANKPQEQAPTRKMPGGRRPPAGAPKGGAGRANAPTPEAAGEGEDQGNLGKVMIRNEFYRDGYRTLLRLAVMEAFIILGLIGAMLFVIQVHQPENRYFATTEDGRLIPMVPLSEPNLSSPALVSWAAQAATEVMSFGFTDYRRRLQSSSAYFTRKGWESFTEALQQARYIETLVARNQVITAAPQGAPILKQEGVVQGRYQWVVQIPMVLSFVSGNETRSDSVMVELYIVRVPRLESPSGIGITQWIQRSN